jgi:hypothetical protein
VGMRDMRLLVARIEKSDISSARNRCHVDPSFVAMIGSEKSARFRCARAKDASRS